MATEIRFAFALNGGVSLAIWIGGVVDEVLRFVDAGRRARDGEDDATNPYVALCRELDIVPKVDVLTGSSAGGLNAAFLGTAVIHGCTNLHPIKRLWLDHGSFDAMLRSPTDSSLISVMAGDDNFLPHIREAFKLLAENGTGFVDVHPPVTVRLTATSLGGRVTTLSDADGQITSIDHRAEFVFKNPDFDFAADDQAIERIARACRSTSSFPGAFEPSIVPVDLYEPHHVTGLFDGVTTSTIPVIDGAVLVNLPAQSAIEAIIHQPSSERTERVLALVVPDPGELGQDHEGEPTLNDVLSKSIVGIPRTQSLTDFVRELNEHNSEVRSRRSARHSMLAQFATADAAEAWNDFASVAEVLFAPYRAARLASSLDRIRVGLRSGLPEGGSSLDLTALAAIDPDLVPWVPNELALGGTEWCWGSSPVRRMAAVLITWINTAAEASPATVATGLHSLKDEVSRIRAEADRLSPSADRFPTMLVEELRRDPASVADAFERASARWPTDDPAGSHAAIAGLNDQLSALARCVTSFVGLARSTIEQPPPHVDTKPFVALRGLIRVHDGAARVPADLTRLLLCVEVIEATFAGTEPRADQDIRLLQFTSKGATTIDPLQRSTPIDKLAGVELAHFGAFLKRSWRANDWMWGRLDSAERLVRLLDDMLQHRLSDEGRLATVTRSVQVAILREELPTVFAELEKDAELGGRVSDEGKAFCTAVRSMAGATSGPVDLSTVDEQQLEALFALQQVGSENLAMEVGSDLATMTSISALATTAGVMRAQAPRFLRGPIRVFGTSSSLAWRMARRPRGSHLRNVAIAALVIIGALGLVGTTVDALTSVDLGVFRYVAWLFFVAAPVLSVFAVPWLILRLGRKLMGRQPPH